MDMVYSWTGFLDTDPYKKTYVMNKNDKAVAGIADA
jgi:hypothetical protein